MSTDSDFIDCFGNWRNKKKEMAKVRESNRQYYNDGILNGRSGNETDGLYHPRKGLIPRYNVPLTRKKQGDLRKCFILIAVTQL